MRAIKLPLDTMKMYKKLLDHLRDRPYLLGTIYELCMKCYNVGYKDGLKDGRNIAVDKQY